MPAHQTIAATLEELCPEESRTCFSAQLPSTARLLAEEIGSTTGMVEKRRDEFMHGRYCARSAMQLLGVAAAPILKGPNREPVWPEGIVGSITHTGESAAAIVARSAELVAVGLDMEGSDSLNAELIPMICLPDENPDHDGVRAKLLFSIKEAIYKCLYPLVQEYVDFLEMEVVLNESARTFAARPHAARLDPKLIARIHGRYLCDSQFIISAAWIS